MAARVRRNSGGRQREWTTENLARPLGRNQIVQQIVQQRNMATTKDTKLRGLRDLRGKKNVWKTSFYGFVLQSHRAHGQIHEQRGLRTKEQIEHRETKPTKGKRAAAQTADGDARGAIANEYRARTGLLESRCQSANLPRGRRWRPGAWLIH